MKKVYVLHWIDGTIEKVCGSDVLDAFKCAGHTTDELGELAYFERVD